MFGTSINVMDRMAKRLGLALERPNGRKRAKLGLEAKRK